VSKKEKTLKLFHLPKVEGSSPALAGIEREEMAKIVQMMIIRKLFITKDLL
jgi:hypothetical protein